MPGARTAFVDGKRAPSLEAYFGGVSVVAFTPDDLAVVKGGPDGPPRLPRPHASSTASPPTSTRAASTRGR